MNEVVTTDLPSVAPSLASNLTWADVEALQIPPPVSASGPSPLAFHRDGRPAFNRLMIRGAFLELVTLGFYRFWLATDMRRHLWSHTSAGGDALEYTGTAKELLVGFLFALAILAPIYLLYFFIGLEAERIQAFASLPLAVFFYMFYQFATYRARRYRLSRTIWRGVRFWMTGSGWSYAWRASLWGLLSLVTLGLAMPWGQAALERYKLKHSYYGDLRGRFDGTGWQFFKRGVWLWFAAMLMLVLIIASGIFAATGEKLVPGLGQRGVRVIGIAAISGLLLVLMVGAPFAYAAYKAIEWRWWASGMRFGEVRFESTLRLGALSGLYWIVIGWSALITTCLSAWAAAMVRGAISLHGASGQGAEAMALAFQQPWVLAALVAGYVAAALAFATVVRIHLRHDLWARIAESTQIHNLDAVANVNAAGQVTGALGEGFANNLDIGGF